MMLTKIAICLTLFFSESLSFRSLITTKPKFHISSKLHSTISVPFTTPVENKAFENIKVSGLNGKALFPNVIPSLSEVKSIIPKECFVKDTTKSMAFAALDLTLTSICAFIGANFLLPLKLSPVLAALTWTAYAAVTGTVAIGMWVTAHECGHGAFSNNRKLQDFVGFLFHSALLVPYFSWQRSHAVHHANTNHVIDGETHVPVIAERSLKSTFQKIVGKPIANAFWGASQIFLHLVFGWPAYLFAGKTGGSSRGITNHFIPFPLTKPPNPAKELYPNWNQKMRVLLSDVGIVGAVAGLTMLVKKFGLLTMAKLYGGPYLVVNMWLVLYTWLQHTDVDIPHIGGDDFSFMKGAFLTVDRPYEKILGGSVDFLHHHIGSTHVAHHIDCTIPHYHAKAATKAIRENYPDIYLHDPTPIAQATWRVGTHCSVVQPVKQSIGDGKERELFVFVE